MSGSVRSASKALFAGLDLVARTMEGPRLLIYHQVGGGSGLEMEVEPDTFRRQLDWLASNYPVVDLEDALASPERESVVLTFDDGYRSVFDVAFDLMVERAMPFTLYLTTEPIETKQPLRDHPGADPLTWDMIKIMLDSQLVTLGAHTHTHPDLRHLDEKEVERDLSICDGLIQERLNVSPVHFAYPWGYWSPVADSVVRRRYRTATLGSRLPLQRLDDSHLIHRTPVQLSDGMRWFGARVNRGLLFEERIRRTVRRYAGP